MESWVVDEFDLEQVEHDEPHVRALMPQAAPPGVQGAEDSGAAGAAEGGSRRRLVAAALSGALLGGAAIAACVAGTGASLPGFQHPYGLAVMKGQLPCYHTERDTAYRCRSRAFGGFPRVHDIEECRRKCFDYARCSVWTLRPDGECLLFELEQNEMPMVEESPGSTSGGLPCGGESFRPSGSLYCFALMQPYSYEKELLRYAMYQQTSLFDCDEYDIYSNKSITLDDDIETVVVHIDLSCERGGEFRTALNVDIFLAVWEEVFNQGRWSDHEWTVKVDPDAVFFPDRLRTVLAHHPEPSNGVYLNNCRFGLHGPVEVLSKSAVGALKDAREQCDDHFLQLCSGDCHWGEDMWLDQCMQVLGVQRDDEWQLLVEDHCDGPQNFGPGMACDGNHVSFHPFKDVSSYEQCLSYSQLPAQMPATQFATSIRD